MNSSYNLIIFLSTWQGALQSEISKIVVETDQKDPKTIAVITADDVDSAEGFRVRITPKYD